MSEDPNETRSDPMVPEYWALGEELQDRILALGFESATVDPIAVDVHDLLQAADRIRQELIPSLLETSDRSVVEGLLRELAAEFLHVRWHCESAERYLGLALG